MSYFYDDGEPVRVDGMNFCSMSCYYNWLAMNPQEEKE